MKPIRRPTDRTMYALSLAILSPLALPLAAQEDGSAGQRGNQDAQTQGQAQSQRDRRTQDRPAVDPIFHRSSELLGVEVMNKREEQFGEIEDFILNLQTGSVPYVIVEGDRSVAVPVEAFRWDVIDNRYVMTVPLSAFKEAPEFNAETFETDLWTREWRQQTERLFGAAPRWQAADSEAWDRWSVEAFGETDPKRYSGTVTSIVEERPENIDSEYVFLDMEQSGRTHRVLMGPAWYIRSLEDTPAIGDNVEISAIRVIRNGQEILVASTTRRDGVSVKLRDETTGRPYWWYHADTEDNPRVRSPRRFALLSEIDDADVLAQGTDDQVGTVDDIALETQSGHAAFAIVGSGGIADIGDDHYLVPWQAMRVDRDLNLLIALPRNDFEGAPIMSEDGLWSLKTSATRENIYSFYNVKQPRFTARHARAMADVRNTSGWNAGSEFNRHFDVKTVRAFDGVVQAVNRDAPMPGMANGYILKVESEDQTRHVILAPIWYIESNDFALENGDEVWIEGSLATINEKECILASVIKRGEQRLFLRDEQGDPNWSDSRVSETDDERDDDHR